MTGIYSSRTWDLNYEFPTQSDYIEEIQLCYNDDFIAAFPYESADGTDVFQEVREDFINYWGPLDPDMISGIPNIRGIKKVNDTTVTIEMEWFATNQIYTLDIPITPLHYYGSSAKYNYEKNMFGFNFADLSLQRSKNYAPMGAGPYQFDSKQGDVNYLRANKYYYKGEPKINQIAFVKDAGPSLSVAISSGNLDLADYDNIPFGLDDIFNLNSNGELTGNVITTIKKERLYYEFIGINAKNVKVGDDPSSVASRNLRKALATIFAVHRKPAIEGYLSSDYMNVNEYPTIQSLWDSPQPGDSNYREAFSVDVNGDSIYTPGMTQEQRVAAAKQAALGFFEAAGFAVSGGDVVSAPRGAKLSHEIIIDAGGTGNHPSFGLLVAAQETLSEIGITLKINDPEDPNVLWDAVHNGTQELWAWSRSISIDPVLYSDYYSFNVVDQPDAYQSNYYYIRDPELDSLIVQAYSSDQWTRKRLYQQAYDIIMDWGVEIPYSTWNGFFLFSTQRIDTDTITPDITPFWDWQNDIENMRMKLQ